MDLVSIVKEKIPKGTKSILLALSGGPDSMVLLDILDSISKSQKNYVLYAAHVNHKLRAEADDEMISLEKACTGRGVKLFTLEVDVKKLALERKNGIEEAGRFARYSFLDECLAENAIDFVALAHHQNDQAETVLLNMYRGAGLGGIAGMAEYNGYCFRPLLGFSKDQIMGYASEKNLEYFTDKSNFDDTYFRNFVRKQLEQVEVRRTGSIANIDRLAKLAEADDEFIGEIAREKYRNLLENKRLRIRGLDKEADPVKSRILRLWLNDSIKIRDIEQIHINEISKLLQLRSGSRISLPRGWEVIRNYEYLDIQAQKTKSECENWSVDFELGTTEVAQGVITANVVLNNMKITSGWPERARVSIELLKMNAVIRRRRKGDRIKPFGSAGSKKLKDFFIDKKIERNLRNLPIICAGSEVLWVPGYAISESLKVVDEDEKVVILQLSPTE